MNKDNIIDWIFVTLFTALVIFTIWGIATNKFSSDPTNTYINKTINI
jgi:hypothetical protein